METYKGQIVETGLSTEAAVGLSTEVAAGLSTKIGMGLGAGAGFTLFLINLASMEGIFTRPDDANNKVFTLGGLWHYLKAPFMVGTIQFTTVWGALPGITLWDRIKLLSANWVVLTLGGLIIGVLLV